MQLLLHPQTERQISLYLSAPSHALIISGPSGMGKKSIASLITTSMLADLDESLRTAYTKILHPKDGKQISIESVRELEHFLSLKVPSHNFINRVAIIENGHLLTLQAQNALLKTLEEPPKGTVIIITTNHIQSLLVTIRSRSQQMNIEPPATNELGTYFLRKGYKQINVQKALSMSGGLPALTQALLDGEDHPLMIATEMAKKILILPLYKRLALVDELVKQKDLCINTFFILQQMAHISLRSASDEQAKRWASIYKGSYDALEALEHNGQPKLIACNFIMSI
jgi:DNA polymerase-3 subunit delta'